MTRFLVLTILLGLAAMLVGCGGASAPSVSSEAVAPSAAEPAASVGPTPAAVDPALVGTWLLVHAKMDGKDGAIRTLLNIPLGTTRDVLVFAANGTVTEYWYRTNGSTVGSREGTWTATAPDASFTWTEGGGAHPFKYAIAANVCTVTMHEGGHVKVLRLVKIQQQTGHDAALVKSWRLASVWQNGVAKTIPFLTGDIRYKNYAWQFWGDGTLQRYRLQQGKIIVLPMLPTLNWSTSGAVLRQGPNVYDRAIYLVQGGDLYVWRLDDAGNTLKLWFKPWAPAGSHAAAWVGTWTPVSGTIEGSAATLAEIFHWEGGVNGLYLDFFADGTAREGDYATGVLTRAWLGYWTASGGAATLTTADSIVVMTYTVPGAGQLQCTWTDPGGTKVVLFNAVF